MNPVYDIVCVLLETSFSRWKDEDKKEVLNCGRPTESLQICGTKEVKYSGKCYNLSFKRSWFREFPWLCSSPTLQKLFCWPCLLFSNKSNVWNREGFASLLNITRSLHKHSDSAEHIKCQVNLKTFERNRNTISDALKENARLYTMQFNENVRLNRLFLQLVIDAVLYLSKQELAFRGHDETIDSINRGNFKELLTLLVSRSPVEIQNQYSKIKSVFSGESKSIQNELIECISDYINDFVKTELETAGFFSVQVDDTTDITQVSQCSVIVRFVNADGALVERFLGFYDVSADRSSETLFALLDKLLRPFGYEHKLVGQCYDGASVMSGHLNGLQKKIKEKAPLAVFVHCLAHRLNLVLQQSCKKIRKCRIFFSSITGIPTFFHHSAKRTYAITSASGPRIPTVTPVRWSSNSKLLSVIVDDWEKLKEVFETIVCCEQSDDNSTQLARGFLHDMNSFEFLFLAVVFHDIFCLTDVLFDVLQKRSLDVNYCISKIRTTCDMLRNKRDEQYFSVIFEKTRKMTDMRLTREYSSLPQDEYVQIYRALYYEILDHILMEMDERFRDCEKIQFVCLADTTKFEEYHTCFPSSALENVQNFFGSVFPKTHRLRNELSILYADEKYRQISTEKMFEILHEDKDIFTDAYKLFSLILSISSTTASVERSFSCLKRIKTYLRNAISEERLSSLGNIAIQKELLLQLMKKQPFYEDITDKFAALKDRRIDLVYKK